MSRLRITTWLAVLANLLLYGMVLAGDLFRWLYPRIEVLTGTPYVWPVTYRISFAVQTLIALVVIAGVISFLTARSTLGVHMVAFAVAIHAGIGIGSAIMGYPELKELGLTYYDAPGEIVIPLIVLVLAIANWRWSYRLSV